MGGLVGFVVIADAEPGAVGAALGMGMGGLVDVTRSVTASTPSSTASSRSRRRSRPAASTGWTSAYVATNTEISIGLLGLQVVREGCHEPVTLRERCAGLLRSFADEDLHPLKGASRFGVDRTVQLIHRVAGLRGPGRSRSLVKVMRDRFRMRQRAERRCTQRDVHR
jgi:hypothetical protein